MLNKLIICGIFILIIIYYFNKNLQESCLTSNQGDSVLKNLKNDFNDIYRKKQSGSSSHVTGILNTVSSHLQTLHTQQTIDLIKENSYTSDDNKSTQINSRNLNSCSDIVIYDDSKSKYTKLSKKARAKKCSRAN